MSMFDRFRDLFSTTGCNQNATFNSNINPITTNPSSGLPMTGAIDIAGNAYGSNSTNTHTQIHNHDYYHSSLNNAISSTTHQSYDYNNNYNDPFNNY